MASQPTVPSLSAGSSPRSVLGLSLRSQLMLAFLALTLASVGTLAWMNDRNSRAILTQKVGDHLAEVVRVKGLTIAQFLMPYLDAMRALALNELVEDRVTKRNAAYPGSTAEIHAELAALDRQWLQAGTDDPLVRERLGNDVALELCEFKRTFPRFVEVFVTDRSGGLVGACDRTTDYDQSDEEWWQAAFASGRGSLYVGTPRFDESSQTYGLALAAPIPRNGGDGVIGIVRTTIDTEHIVQLLGVGELGETGLLLPDGSFLSSHGGKARPLSEASLAALGALPVLDPRKELPGSTLGFATAVFEGEPNVISQAFVLPETDEQYFRQLGWRVVLHESKERVLAPVTEQRRTMAGVAALIAAFAVIAALMLSRGIAAPITRLATAARRLAEGDSSARAELTPGRSELSRLGETFDHMATSLEQREKELEEQRALLARRVEERTADLSRANAELAKAAGAKDEFLASMSHELRTPLNAVLTICESLEEGVYGGLEEKQLRALRTVSESGRHLLELINDILDLSKIEAGKLDMLLGAVSIERVCEASLRLVKQQAQEKRLQISLTIDHGVTTIRADERRLKQILVNLLSNAVKFTPAEGRIGLEVVGNEETGVVDFTVWDSGIGIARDDLPKLFKAFVQLDSGLARQYSGTGLGLSLVYRLAELHGGSVSVESEPGRGSRFRVSLPWVAMEAEDTSFRGGTGGTVERPPAIGNALLVEDAQTAADQVTRYLRELGAQVHLHSREQGALDKALEVRPELIVLDILLPDGSGWDVLAALKQNPATRDVPVMVVSVLEEQSLAAASGAAGYLVKPISRPRFVEAVRRILAEPSGFEKALVVGPSTADGRSAAPRILVAEDNLANMDTICDYLRALGYHVVQAWNGAEAVERALEVGPDLILMDIQMPGVDGLEATRRIRADRKLAATPIFALTALAMPGDRERCLQAGADEYVTKPVRLKELARMIENRLLAKVRVVR